MVVSNLCTLAVESHAQFVDALLAPGRSTSVVRTGIIHTIVSFSHTSNGLTFTTTSHDTLRVSKSISKGIVSVVTSIPRVTELTAFKPLLLNSIMKGSDRTIDPDATQFVSGPDLEQMVLTASKYECNTKLMLETIQSEFEECLKQSQVIYFLMEEPLCLFYEQFLEYREVFDQHREWDFDAYAAKAMSDVNQLSKDITLQKMWELKIKEMIPQLNVISLFSIIWEFVFLGGGVAGRFEK